MTFDRNQRLQEASPSFRFNTHKQNCLFHSSPLSALFMNQHSFQFKNFDKHKEEDTNVRWSTTTTTTTSIDRIIS